MSTIAWTDITWNPTVGCQRVSPGCENCYAEVFAHRGLHPAHRGLTTRPKRGGARWTGEVRLVPERIWEPLRWNSRKRRQRVFVNSLSDLFHHDVPFEFIAACYATMAACPNLTFQILTKRPERALEFYEWMDTYRYHGLQPMNCAAEIEATVWFQLDYITPALFDEHPELFDDHPERPLSSVDRIERGEVPCKIRERGAIPWPLNNVWIGVSVEDSDHRFRLDELMQIPAWVRFASIEPLLSAAMVIDPWLPCFVPRCMDHKVRDARAPYLDWVIVGGESGHGARPCHVAAIAQVVDQCRHAGVPVFVKQLGAHPIARCPFDTGGDSGARTRAGTNPIEIETTDRKGEHMADFPMDLRIREFPDGCR